MNASVAVAPAPSGACEPRLVVLDDSDCGPCTATAKRLRRWDRAGRLEGPACDVPR
jgi:hypothetical protein